ncbi:MAG: hypothetical protein AB7I30_18600 [Isosphaeraceae bacterium]
MSRKKPPSQRPERKLDEAAKAIARLKDTAEVEKTKESSRPDQTKIPPSRLSKEFANRKSGSSPVYPSTKKPKKV